LIKQTVRGGRVTRQRVPTVNNTVIVNADSEDEAIRKGLKYFRYTSRDAYAIKSAQEMSPGKWKVTGLVRNPTSNDKTRPFQPNKETEVNTEVREPFSEQQV